MKTAEVAKRVLLLRSQRCQALSKIIFLDSTTLRVALGTGLEVFIELGARMRVKIIENNRNMKEIS